MVQHKNSYLKTKEKIFVSFSIISTIELAIMENNNDLIEKNICQMKAKRISYTIEDSIKLHGLEVKEFASRYKAKFPSSILFSKIYETKFEPNSHFNPINVYHSSNICYKKEEESTCSGKRYTNISGKKTNTYILCPICQPFEEKSGLFRDEKREGSIVRFDIGEPKFYDTLHSQFDHHMNHCHGIFRDGSVAPQPLIGFFESNKDFNLHAICPLLQKHRKSEPCMQIFKINGNKTSESPFKSYFRHYTKYHWGNSTFLKESKEIYQAEKRNGQKNIIIPLNPVTFQNEMEKLKKSCPSIEVHFEKNHDLYNFKPELNHDLSDSDNEEIDKNRIDLSIFQLPIESYDFIKSQSQGNFGLEEIDGFYFIVETSFSEFRFY